MRRHLSEDRVIARERFRVHVQVALYNLMRAEGVSQRELAQRLGVSEARVSQMLGSAGNLTVRTLGKVLHVLGRRPEDGLAILATTLRKPDEADTREPYHGIPAATEYQRYAAKVETQRCAECKRVLGSWSDKPCFLCG